MLYVNNFWNISSMEYLRKKEFRKENLTLKRYIGKTISNQIMEAQTHITYYGPEDKVANNNSETAKNSSQKAENPLRSLRRPLCSLRLKYALQDFHIALSFLVILNTL